MVRRLPVLTSDEAVSPGPAATGQGARSINASAVPIQSHLLDGKLRSITELEELFGCHVTTMRSRLDYG